VSKPSLTTVEPPSNLPQPIRIEPGGLPWLHPVAEQKPEQQTLQLDEKCGTIALFHYGPHFLGPPFTVLHIFQ
jgi:hypothetical protein